MPLFSKLRKPQQLSWEEGFTPEAREAFYAQIGEYLARRGIGYELQDGGLVLNEDGTKIGLRNLAQTCQQSSQLEWPSMIAAHFGNVDVIRSSAQSIEGLAFSEAAGMLVVRLWPEGRAQGANAKNLVFRRELEGTISTVVLDMPNAIVAPTPTMVRQWGKSPNELFSLGYSNLGRLCQPEILHQRLLGTIDSVMLVKQDNYLTATHLLRLDAHPECLGIYGALASAPVSDGVICFPLNSKQDLSDTALLLAAVTLRVFRQGPRSVSPYLYWYYQKNFETVRYDSSRDSATIPKRLAELLLEAP